MGYALSILPADPREGLADAVGRRLADVAARADELAHRGCRVVGIDLVADEEQQLRPLAVILREHPRRERIEDVPILARYFMMEFAVCTI